MTSYLRKLCGLCFVALVLAVPCSAAKKTYGTLYPSRIVSVYDGDTFKVDFDDFHPIIGENLSIRVYGIDTPEIRTRDAAEKALGYEARDYAASWLLSAETIELRNCCRGKYFRIIAEVYVDGESLADIMIDAGLAKPYYGGKRPDWSTGN